MKVKRKKSIVLLLCSVLTITACGQKPAQNTGGTGSDGTPTPTPVSDVSVTPEATLAPVNSSTPEPTQEVEATDMTPEPTLTPEPEVSLTPTIEAEPSPTPTETPAPVPTEAQTVLVTPKPTATNTPTPTNTPMPTPTNTPTPTPIPTPTPRPSAAELVNKINEAKIGDTVLFGSYEQDNDLTNGAEDIEWIVLDRQDGKVLLLSKYGLDWKLYYQSMAGSTWETCDMRSWLNDEFYYDAFSNAEQGYITVTLVHTEDDQFNGIEGEIGGNDTLDKVFLLSVEELEMYFGSDPYEQDLSRAVKVTEYAKAQGAYFSEYKPEYYGNGTWWLRSPGFASHILQVDNTGKVDHYGSYGDEPFYAVRPAMWVTLNPEAMPTPTPTISGIPLDAEHFPDATFRQYLYLYADTNRDKVLSQEEREAVTRIRNDHWDYDKDDAWNEANIDTEPYIEELDKFYYAGNIQSLQGIEYFPNLYEIQLKGITFADEVTELFISNPKIEILEVNYKPGNVRAIHINCPELRYCILSCSELKDTYSFILEGKTNKDVTELYLDEAGSLQTLRLYQVCIGSWEELGNCKNLKSAELAECSLTDEQAAYLKQLTGLEYLELWLWNDTVLDELNLSQNENLKTVWLCGAFQVKKMILPDASVKAACTYYAMDENGVIQRRDGTDPEIVYE